MTHSNTTGYENMITAEKKKRIEREIRTPHRPGIIKRSPNHENMINTEIKQRNIIHL